MFLQRHHHHDSRTYRRTGFGSDLVLQMNTTGEGNSTGLQAGVGFQTLKVDVLGPVLIALNSTALKLQTQPCLSAQLDTSRLLVQLLLLSVN